MDSSKTFVILPFVFLIIPRQCTIRIPLAINEPCGGVSPLPPPWCQDKAGGCHVLGLYHLIYERIPTVEPSIFFKQQMDREQWNGWLSFGRSSLICSLFTSRYVPTDQHLAITIINQNAWKCHEVYC
ncbi:hypothetical protein DERF_005430 [Dermatophagoides farinae]|uniref:Uncharacterized protein n=1 Tax=Dermatophagoides farinae TaxID=6954 RepID=A0A922I5T9_DERFA|nr:hypothetical protein DERF_005430 [Dermatophagoides farinae]